MATLEPSDDGDSDYGYDLTAEEEALVSAVIANLSPAPTSAGDATATATTTATTSVDENTGRAATVAFDGHDFDFEISELESPSGHGPQVGRGPDAAAQPRSMPARLTDRDISYPDLTSALLDLHSAQPEPPEIPRQDPAEEDPRAPITRFRTFPRKPFSVSDFTAGAWCEIQYYYVLTRLRGRKIRTAAMKGGTKVHEKLESEIYTTVKVDVRKKEDGFGLRFWNIIQGLRTLRDTGLTRELEVWGLVDGNVVNGIIDGLSYQNPDPEFEEEVRSSQSSQNSQPSQPQITTFFPSSAPQAKPERNKQVYITDVKTRASRIPPKGAQVRSTKIQLFLYHRFLSEMAAGKLDYLRVLRRYGLDPDEPFSDEFVAQIGALHDEIFADAPLTQETPPSSQVPSSEVTPPHSASGNPGSSPPPDLIKYQTLRALQRLLAEELRLTFPNGADSIGPIVAVEYRARASAEDEGGAVLSENLFAVDNETLDNYLSQYMEWWNGERRARGVPINETFKCRSCDFIDDCEWRMGQDQDVLRQAREKPRTRGSKTSAEVW